MQRAHQVSLDGQVRQVLVGLGPRVLAVTRAPLEMLGPLDILEIQETLEIQVILARRALQETRVFLAQLSIQVRRDRQGAQALQEILDPRV